MKRNNNKKLTNNNIDKNIFCLLPWKKFILDMGSISFGCQCIDIDVSKYLANIDDIWNCKEMVEYRKNILQKRENACKIFLKNR